MRAPTALGLLLSSIESPLRVNRRESPTSTQQLGDGAGRQAAQLTEGRAGGPDQRLELAADRLLARVKLGDLRAVAVRRAARVARESTGERTGTLSSLAENGIPLREFVAAIREELEAARREAQEAAAGKGKDAIRFTVGPVSVQFTLAATRSKDGKGGVSFYVFTLGADLSKSTVSTQQVSLTLTPTTGDGSPVEVSDDTVPASAE